MTFVLDASVAMAWCFEDERDPVAERCLDRLSAEDARVPALWAYEVSNVLVVAQRRGRLTEAAVTQFLALVGELPIDVTPEEPVPAALVATAARHDLSAYDAAYLVLAERHGLPLATLDRRLAAAARKAGVLLLD